MPASKAPVHANDLASDPVFKSIPAFAAPRNPSIASLFAKVRHQVNARACIVNSWPEQGGQLPETLPGSRFRPGDPDAGENQRGAGKLQRRKRLAEDGPSEECGGQGLDENHKG